MTIIYIFEVELSIFYITILIHLLNKLKLAVNAEISIKFLARIN